MDVAVAVAVAVAIAVVVVVHAHFLIEAAAAVTKERTWSRRYELLCLRVTTLTS